MTNDTPDVRELASVCSKNGARTSAVPLPNNATRHFSSIFPETNRSPEPCVPTNPLRYIGGDASEG